LNLLVGGDEGYPFYCGRCGNDVVGGVFILPKINANGGIGNFRSEILQDIVARLKDEVDEGLIVDIDDQSCVFIKKKKIKKGKKKK
jgi:hypothetical protein